MATAAELLAEAQNALDGEVGSELRALGLFRQAGMLAFSQRDYENAENACRAAMVCVTTISDSEAGGGKAYSKLTWSLNQIDALLNQIRAARRADGDSALESIPIRYERESGGSRITQQGGSF